MCENEFPDSIIIDLKPMVSFSGGMYEQAHENNHTGYALKYSIL